MKGTSNERSTGTGYLGTAPGAINIAQAIPGGPGFIDPTIPSQGASLGDTVYVCLHSIFDPRTLSNYNGTSVYSGMPSGYAYTQLAKDYLLRMIFDKFKMRNEPADSTLNDMIDCICDISRMFGILMTAYTLKQSRDPEMFQRARALELHNTFAEMSTILAELPLPRNIAALNAKYVRLMDVASSDNYQNLGFLVTGDYTAFLTLFNNVRQKSLALNYLRQMYPKLGVVGDPGNQSIPDVLEAFCNGSGLHVGANGFSPYIFAQGATQEPQQLASFGVLSSVIDSASGPDYTVTGFAIPGSGFGGKASQRIYVPTICRWDGTSDAAVVRSASATYDAATATAIRAQSVQDVNLAANIGHEYNLSYDGSTSQANYTTFNQSAGAASGPELLALENTRYRVSAGFSLGSLSYRLDGNVMTGLYALLS